MFFADWLFIYSDIDKKQEVIRAIFTSDIVHDQDCLQIMFKYKEKMIGIINSAGDEASDFQEVILNMIKTDSSDELASFAKYLGIKNKKKGDDKYS